MKNLFGIYFIKNYLRNYEDLPMDTPFIEYEWYSKLEEIREDSKIFKTRTFRISPREINKFKKKWAI